MQQQEQIFPEPLAKLNKLDFDYGDGDGIDFEPYPEFLSGEETVSHRKERLTIKGVLLRA